LHWKIVIFTGMTIIAVATLNIYSKPSAYVKLCD